MRLFFAVALPDTIREKLSALERSLGKKAPGAPVGWVVPQNIHLTLRFLGETDERLIPRVREAGGAVAGTFPPFSLVLEKVGSFGGRASPRVVWVGVRDDAGMARLREVAEGLERSVRQLGFAAESRPFAAHATIGRVKPGPTKPLVAALEAHKDFEGGALAVDRFVLYESRMRGGRPPEYSQVESFPLQGQDRT